MHETDRAAGPDRFTAIGVTEFEDVTGPDGLIRDNDLDDFVLFILDVREYSDWQTELPAAVFKQGFEPLGKGEILGRGDFMKRAQSIPGLPAFGDFMLQRRFRLFPFSNFRFQPGIARGELPGAIGDPFLELGT